MNRVVGGLRRHRRLLIAPALLLAALTATPVAVAAPHWEVSTVAQNPLGEASFERGSASNVYKVTIVNTGDEVAGGQGVGTTLACTGGPASATTLRYRWLRNGAEIAGADAGTYVVVAGDVGAAIQCEVLASTAEATTVALSSQTLVAPMPSTLPPAFSVKPAIAGTAKVGETFTCSAGTSTPAAERYEYLWLRAGAAIAGAGSGSTTATSFGYTTVNADAGEPLQCEVIASDAGGAVAAVSPLKVPLGTPPASAAAPVVTGTGLVGETLTCTNSTWTGAPSEFEYQWLRDGVPISGARLPRTTASSFEYKLQSEDEKVAVQCEVTAAGAGGVAGRVSAPLAVGTLSAAPSSPPTILLAAAKVGAGVACSHGTWSPTASSYEFKWLRNGVPIAGSTTGPGSTAGSVTYTPVTADVGKALQCEVIATNAGGSYAAGISAASYVSSTTVTATATIATQAMTVTDTLPYGVKLGSRTPPVKSMPSGWACEVASEASGIERCGAVNDVVRPGESRIFEFWVRTTAAAPEAVTNVVKVSGGGASPGTTTSEYQTPITPGGFAIESFQTTVLDELGLPFTQSTGHPFEATASFVFRATSTEPFSGVGNMVTAGGDPKNVEVQLPPGFVGAPDLEPQCSLEEFQAQQCETSSPKSEIGFIKIANTANVVGKSIVPHYESSYENESMIFNLKPPAGSPAAFGFEIYGAKFLLLASVRSDGNYGVTITSVDTPSTPITLLASEVTFCGYGASRVFLGFLPGHFLPQVRDACSAARPGAASFLTGPSQCTGSVPVTTIRANSWEHPETYVSKTVYTGSSAGVLAGEPSGSESLVTGCQEPMFQPRLESTPDTTQADAPTGLAVKLKVPQQDYVPAIAAGQTLACLAGAWTEYPTGYTYQWLRDGAEVAGATHQTYTVAAAAETASLQCRATASNAGGGAAAITAAAEPASALPAPTGSPEVSGSSEEGETLTCAPGSWSGDPTGFSYQWLRNGISISGASSNSYVVQVGDAPSVLQCQVSATNAAGSIATVSEDIVTSPAPVQPPIYAGQAEISSPSGPDTPEVKDVSVEFPAGMSLSPSAADGLQGCTDAQFGVHSLEAAACPEASKIGTVKITTPLLTAPLAGQLFLGQPLCGEGTPCTSEDAQDGRMFRLFIQAIDTEDGVLVKVPGTVSVDPATGRFTASFDEDPQLPFEDLELRLKNGPRAPLATPQTCGAATTRSVIAPWSAPGLGGISGSEQLPGTPDAEGEESFDVSWDGQGGQCPDSLPFNPGFSAGASVAAAGTPSGNGLSVGISREDREQNLAGITLHTPEGLLGMVSKVQLCEEPQAAQGSCGAESRIGTVTAGVGPGLPFVVSGPVYLTGPYEGQPFGLSIVVPAKAGPFNLGDVVVRASIAIDPRTAELTVVSGAFPQILDGIPLRLRSVHVDVNRPGFIVNPTSCEGKQITATILGAPPLNDPGQPAKTANVASSFDVDGCAEVPFKPSFSASTEAKTSRKDGASLHVEITYPESGQADIKRVHVELPKALPSRLSTLQKACPEATFAANPASCPAASVVGNAIAHTPVLSVPLQGPAYFVSHGGQRFPELILVLQGQGVTIILEGETFISKAGVTSSTFKTVPDAPVSSFELTLPEGAHSALAAPGNNLCAEAKKLSMPTTIDAQNGRQITQQTKIAVTGCARQKTAKRRHRKHAKAQTRRSGPRTGQAR
ncbi:MAG TPA: hypothetical protein VGF95_07625 [Solirubrobacteraceae bacterium]|jgi:hypothetical protein